MDYRFDHFRREHLADDRAFAAGRDPGWSMPDFDLPTVAGGRVRKSDFMGRRPVLLTCASLTDPLAASAVPVLKRLYEDLGEEVAFVTVYVREAHPGERIPQPATPDEKLRHARALRARDGLPWTVAVDDVEGTLHRALGGTANAAYVMDAAGNVAFRTLWSNDERVLRQALEALMLGSPGHPFERARRLVPMARGIARMDDVVRAAGPSALDDLRREAPLVYAAAEVAWAWRALTPLGRATLVASALVAAAAVTTAARLVVRAARGR